MLYYLLINLQFHTTNTLEHLKYYFLLRNYEQNINKYYFLLLNIYRDTINFMELYHFWLIIMQLCIHIYF